MKVKYIRMISGEDIVAEITEQSQETVTIKNPLQIIMQQPKGPNQPPSIALVPWLMFADQTSIKAGVTISASAVVFQIDAVQDLVAEYTKNFSPLVLPQGGKIILPPRS